jgi:hypothetical protein
MPEPQCDYEFAPGLRCHLIAGHDEPYYPYLDRGQTGFYSDILSEGTAHAIFSEVPPRPPREDWTGAERRDTVMRSRAVPGLPISQDVPR